MRRSLELVNQGADDDLENGEERLNKNDDDDISDNDDDDVSLLATKSQRSEKQLDETDIALFLSAFGTLMCASRTIGIWLLARIYLRRAYVTTPFALVALIDCTMLFVLVMAEPNTVPRRIRPENRQANEEKAPPMRRMDLYMTYVFKQRRYRAKERKSERQGVNRLGIRVPKGLLSYITPRRRAVCCWLVLWALVEGFVAGGTGVFLVAMRDVATLEPDGRAVHEWPVLRFYMGLVGNTALFVSPLLRLGQAVSLILCALMPRPFLLDDPGKTSKAAKEARAYRDEGVQRKKQLRHRKWTIGARIRRPLLCYAVVFWLSSIVLFAIVSSTLVSAQFTAAKHQARGNYWDRWLPFPSERLVVSDTRTATGTRIDFPLDAYPPLRSAKHSGAEVDMPALMGAASEGIDGFGSSTPVLFSLANLEHLAEGLFGPDDMAKSTSPDSKTLLLNTKTGEVVPHWVEVDAWDERKTAMLVPAAPLDRATWYVVCVRGLVDIRDGRLLPKAPGVAKTQREFIAAPPTERSSGIGRPASVADDDIAMASGEVVTELTAEEFLKEERILIERALERVWFNPASKLKAWVSDPDLQVAFSFPTASAASTLFSLSAEHRNKTETWLESLTAKSKAPSFKITQIDAEQCVRKKNKNVFNDMGTESIQGGLDGLQEGLDSLGGQVAGDVVGDALDDGDDGSGRGGGGARGRVVWGTMTVPTFLSSTSSRYAGLEEGGWGGFDSHVGIVLSIPCSVLTGETPLRAVVQYGHEIFDDRSQATEHWLLKMADEHGLALVASDWRGLSRFDLPIIARALVAHPHLLRSTADRLLQAFVDQVTLSHLALPLIQKQMKLKLDETESELNTEYVCSDDNRVKQAVGQTCAELAILGACEVYFCPTCKYSGLCDLSCKMCNLETPVSSEDVPIVFMGRGTGALLGAGFASWAAPFKSFSRFALLSPGSSLFGATATRSEGFTILGMMWDLCLFEKRSIRFIMSLINTIFEGSTHPPTHVGDSKPISVRAPILIQAALGDASAPPLAAETLARTLNAKATTPAVRDVFQVPLWETENTLPTNKATDPPSSAPTVYDNSTVRVGEGGVWYGNGVTVFTEWLYELNFLKMPLDNTSPDANDVHQCLRTDEDAKYQLSRFILGKFENISDVASSPCGNEPCVRESCSA